MAALSASFGHHQLKCWYLLQLEGKLASGVAHVTRYPIKDKALGSCRSLIRMLDRLAYLVFGALVSTPL